MTYRRAGVDDGPPRVAIGARVELELVDETAAAEPLTLVVVPDSAADFTAGFLGAGTPLARAILGHLAGSTLAYRQGDVVEVRILSVTPGDVPDTGADATRQAVIDQAIDKSDRTNAAQLALTVSVKWGDWDPEGIVPTEE